MTAKASAKSKSAPASRAKAPAAKAKAPVEAPKPAPPAPVVTARPAAAPAPVAVKVVAVPAVERKPVVTTISARIDIGFGNTLYIRGEGTGLSWDAGLRMDCIENDLWRVTLGESAQGFTFKFLVNDLSWSVGPDYTAACGSSLTLTPEF